MAKLTEKQCELAVRILKSGRCTVSKDSSSDYVEMAAFIFDNGCFFNRELWIEELGRAALAKEPRT